MPWTYEQASGWMTSPDGGKLAIGYSGVGAGLNNPSAENIPFVGPLPRGTYTIGAPIDSAKHGPFFLPLSPDAANEMFERNDFGIHGDEIAHPGQHLASEGCIILPRFARGRIAESLDKVLQVIAEVMLT